MKHKKRFLKVDISIYKNTSGPPRPPDLIHSYVWMKDNVTTIVYCYNPKHPTYCRDHRIIVRANPSTLKNPTDFFTLISTDNFREAIRAAYGYTVMFASTKGG